MLRYVDALGNYTLSVIYRASEILALLKLLISARATVAHRSRRRIFHKLYRLQLFNTGVLSLYVTAVVAVVIGFLLVFQLPSFTSREQILPTFSDLYIVIVIRELAPLMCALILISRVGTAITAKIGYLKVFREFEALRTMGINPVHLFLVPVFFAFPLSMIILVMYFNFFALAAAYITLLLQDPGLGARLLLDNILQRLEPNDIVIVLIKVVVSGLIIGLYSIYYGSRMHGRLRDITSAMSKATTRQFVLVFVVNVMITVLAYH